MSAETANNGVEVIGVPGDEPERLAELHALELLDAPADPQLDRMTEFAAALFRVPLALVSLVDRDRLWFASAQGTSLTETPREQAFCAACVAQDAALVVRDAADDARFRDAPVVAAPPHIRFYAGTPVRGPGNHAIGTLCVLDTLPREFTADQQGHLQRLGAIVEDRLWQRYASGRARGESPDGQAGLAAAIDRWISPDGLGPARRRFAVLVLEAGADGPSAPALAAAVGDRGEVVAPVDPAQPQRLGALIHAGRAADADVVATVVRPCVEALGRYLPGDAAPVTAGFAVYPDDARHADFLLAQAWAGLAGERPDRRIGERAAGA